MNYELNHEKNLNQGLFCSPLDSAWKPHNVFVDGIESKINYNE